MHRLGQSQKVSTEYIDSVKQKVSSTMIKRSRMAQPPPSKSTINNLPDLVLVEILCRLPHKKLIFRSKLVSKRWRTLLSDPYFVNRFLCIQHDQHNPFLNDYVTYMIPYRYAKHKTLVLTMSSEPPSRPLLEASISSIFSFLPCFQGHEYAEKGDKLYVTGTFNDLVLCSPTKTAHRDYYICNSYTKEWIRLPPPRYRQYSDDLPISAGFICDPYCNIKEGDTSSNSAIIKVNAEYRCRIVRILPNQDYKGFDVEIYSSETGEWREYPSSKILCQQRPYTTFRCQSVACNGKLYWLNDGGSIFELDPFNVCTGDVIDKCRFIDAPTPDAHILCWHIGVCQGRLRMCPFFFYCSARYPITIWEMKENQVDGKPEWCLLHHISSLSEMFAKQPFISLSFEIVGFHPVHGDIIYLQHNDIYSEPRYIVTCNVRERTIEIATKIPFENSPGVSWAPEQICHNVIPWWPTPIPTRLNYHEVCLNITVISADTFTIKVGCLSTVKQLKQKIEEKKGTGQYELHFDGRVLEDDDKWLADYGIKDKSKIYIGEHCLQGWLVLEPH